LVGSSNVTLVLTGPALPQPVANFYVVPTSAGVDGQATVVATDTALGACTVPVTFRNRDAVPVGNPEEICHHAESHTFELEGSTPPSLSQFAGCSQGMSTTWSTAAFSASARQLRGISR
jgi:hypothetical protein